MAVAMCPGWDVPQMETSCLSETGLCLLQKNLCNSFRAGKSLQVRLNWGQGWGGKAFFYFWAQECFNLTLSLLCACSHYYTSWMSLSNESQILDLTRTLRLSAVTPFLQLGVLLWSHFTGEAAEAHGKCHSVVPDLILDPATVCTSSTLWYPVLVTTLI